MSTKEARIDRIDARGNIREHVISPDLSTRTGETTALCGRRIHMSQPACGNARCKTCERLSTTRYDVRRFCSPGLRPDCFEVYDTTSGQTASFGMRKHEAIRAARAMNDETTTTTKGPLP